MDRRIVKMKYTIPVEIIYRKTVSWKKDEAGVTLEHNPIPATLKARPNELKKTETNEKTTNRQAYPKAKNLSTGE